MSTSHGNNPSQGRYGSLPSTMTVHGQWTKWRSMNLCGATSKDRLCLIEFQTGYSGKPPLGMRTGFVLRNGMSPKDPLLAAAGDEECGLHAFNPDGIVFLPSLDADLDGKEATMDTELVRARPDANDDVSFHFSIEVEQELRREEFAWRKVKGGEAEAKRNGFRLVRLGSPQTGKDEGETVALLGWVVAWPLTHAFTLDIVDGQSSVLGERWRLMVIVTAIRLYTLHVKGRTKRTVVDIGKPTTKT
ncbi:hypothetical protein BJX61DRAFT_540108 [Aspergillus egyptiacus]|nr:hypothetical protein BJX61DRAFT_540108 [Aspergillus egyptiacus]